MKLTLANFNIMKESSKQTATSYILGLSPHFQQGILGGGDKGEADNFV